MGQIEHEERMCVRPPDGYYVSVGDVIAGKYRVERVLGEGGMASWSPRGTSISTNASRSSS